MTIDNALGRVFKEIDIAAKKLSEDEYYEFLGNLAAALETRFKMVQEDYTNKIVEGMMERSIEEPILESIE